MKRKLVTVLMTAIIGSSMLFAQTAMAADTTAQTEDTAKADETSEAKTEELKTIGEKPEKETEGVTVELHYDLYDHIPVIRKSMEVTNNTPQ